jgi:hypothetical protein
MTSESTADAAWRRLPGSFSEEVAVATDPSPVAGSVYRVAAQAWTETVTGATAPAADAVPIATLGKAVRN